MPRQPLYPHLPKTQKARESVVPLHEERLAEELLPTAMRLREEAYVLFDKGKQFPTKRALQKDARNASDALSDVVVSLGRISRGVYWE